MRVQKSQVRLLAGLSGFLLLCCASGSASLSDRGISVAERNEYINQNGFVISKDLQKAFVEGILAEGMTRDMVLHLFGPPDRTGEKDLVWEYVDARGRDVTGVRFKGDVVVQIYGDPDGRFSKSRTP